ncbi:MAG: response regulator transcription factor [bacterium]
MSETILVVDDEEAIAEFIEINLKRAGFVVFKAFSGTEAIEKVTQHNPALVVLDLMLPDIDGFLVCKTIRSISQVPIIMLTARGEDADKVSGLQLGADDYMVKPFNPQELVERVHAILRRFSGGRRVEEEKILIGDLFIDSMARKVWKGQEAIDLTPKEYNLLIFFVRNPGQIFSREEVRKRVWGHEFVEERSVDVHLRRLREKIGDDAPEANYRYFITVWGQGYKFNSAIPIKNKPRDGMI